MENLITRPIFHGSSPPTPPPTPGDAVITVVGGGGHQQGVGGGGHQQGVGDGGHQQGVGGGGHQKVVGGGGHQQGVGGGDDQQGVGDGGHQQGVGGGGHQQGVGGCGHQQGAAFHGGDGNSPPGIRKIIRDVLIDMNEGLARNPVQGVVGIHLLDYMYKNEGVVATLLKITYGIGCGAVMVGARLKDAWPGLANRVQELATVAFLVFICGSISSYLPFYLGLIAWLAWAATVIAVHVAFSDH